MWTECQCWSSSRLPTVTATRLLLNLGLLSSAETQRKQQEPCEQLLHLPLWSCKCVGAERQSSKNPLRHTDMSHPFTQVMYSRTENKGILFKRFFGLMYYSVNTKIISSKCDFFFLIISFSYCELKWINAFFGVIWLENPRMNNSKHRFGLWHVVKSLITGWQWDETCKR